MNNNKYDQFLFEKELAKRLVNTNIAERRTAYKNLYGEFFERFPNVSYDPKSNIADKIDWQRKFLQPFLNKEMVFLEIGAGSCLLSIEIAKHVKQVIAYEVAHAIPHVNNKPDNLLVKIFDGIDFTELDNSIDLIYSNQVFEHLHIEDTLHHLNQYYNMLKKNGKLIIVTPNALTGPHDISRNFSKKPEGFHMKEYTYKELRNIAKTAGFKIAKGYIGHKKLGYFAINTQVLVTFEKIYHLLSRNVRYNYKNNSLLRNLFGIKLVIRK